MKRLEKVLKRLKSKLISATKAISSTYTQSQLYIQNFMLSIHKRVLRAQKPWVATTKIYTIASGLIAGLYTPFELMLNTIRKTKIFMAKHLPFKPSSIYSYGFEDDNKPTKKKVQRLRFSAPPHNENDTSTSVGSDTSVPESSANAIDLDPHPASKSKDNNPTLTEKSGLQHAPTPNDSDPATADNFTRQQPLPEAVESELQHAPAPSDSDPATATANQDNIIKHQPLSEAVGSDPQPPTPSNSEPVITTGDDHNIIKQQLLPKALGTHSASTRLEDPDNSKTVDTESSTLRRRRPDPTSPSVENATMDRHTTSVVENTHLGLNFFEIPCETSIRQIIRQFVLQNMR